MPVTVEVFYSPLNPDSIRARNLVLSVASQMRNKVVVREVNVDTPEGKDRMRALGIRKVPAIVIGDEYQVVGIPTRGELIELVEKASL